MTQIQFIIIISFVLLQIMANESHSMAKTCNFGTGKCPGAMQRLYYGPSTNVKSIAEFLTSTEDMCTIACTYNSSCWVVTFENEVCRFYPRNVPIDLTHIIMTFKWGCCNEEEVCTIQPYRCRGFWLKHNWKPIVGSKPLQKIDEITQLDCSIKCIQNPICAALNIHGKACELFQFSATYSFSQEINTTTTSFQWHCCKRNDRDLPKICQAVSGKCVGYWVVEEDQPTEDHQIVESFFTTGRNDCLKACQQHPLCTKAFLNQTVATCLLMNRRVASPNGSLCSGDRWILRHGLTWYGYSWSCCNSSQTPLQPMDPDTPSPYGSCVCLNIDSEDFVLAAKDGCTEPLVNSTFEVKSTLAAFWKPRNQEVNVEGHDWTRVFNGDVFLWLRVDKRLYNCPSRHCDQYSTVMPTYSCPDIISRSNWYASPSRGKLSSFLSTPGLAIIIESVCPIWGCYSVIPCSSEMRRLQTSPSIPPDMFDIPYNFIVTDGGHVYEGRGANKVGAHTINYNEVSIGIGVIGWHQNRNVPVKTIIAMRRLLSCLQRRHNLTKEYELNGHRDLVASNSPGRYLYELLPNWGHYRKTKIPVGLPCKEIERNNFIKRCLEAGGFILLSVLITIATVLYAKILSHNKWCPKRRRRYKTKLVTSIGRRNAFPALLDSLNLACMTCAPSGLQMRQDRATLLIALNKNATCNCERLFRLLWSRSMLNPTHHFPSLLSRAVKHQFCRKYTVIVLADGLYLFHTSDFSVIQTATRLLIEDHCLCKLDGLEMNLATEPNLRDVDLWPQDDVVLPQDEHDQLLISVTFDNFTRLPNKNENQEIPENEFESDTYSAAMPHEVPGNVVAIGVSINDTEIDDEQLLT